MTRRFFKFILLTATPSALLLLGACSLPKLKIPFMGESAAVSAPKVPFNPNGVLGYGHTLHFTVYQGALSPGKIFNGGGTVDQTGGLHIKNLSDIKVGGLSALEAVKKIEAAFRTRTGDGIFHVQLDKISDTEVVTVLGSVNRPAVVQWFTAMNVNSALAYVGGRDLKLPGRAVYVTRRGLTRLHANPESGEDIPLQPGDMVSYSSDL